MSDLEQAAQMALEALGIVIADVKTTPTAYEAQRQAIASLRQALEQPTQVPVATEQTDDLVSSHEIRARLRRALKRPKQEPVGEVNRHGLDLAESGTASTGTTQM